MHAGVTRRSIGGSLAVALAAALAVAPTPARAQSFYVLHATLRADRQVVGELYGARVSPTSWASDTAPRVAYADDVVSMEADLSLRDEQTFVAVGVGRGATLQTRSGFRVEMRPLTWAPLLGRAPAGIRVALPAGLPAPSGVLAPAAEAPDGADGPMGPFSHAGPPPSFDPACGALVVHARPDRRAATWTVPSDGAWVHLGPQREAFTRVRVFVDGFVVHGWMRGAIPDCEGTVRMGDVGTACGDGYGTGVVVTLPAGTELFATRTARRPFARLRADTVGVEPLHGPTGRACANGVCQRVPAEPTGPASWILHGHSGEGGWLLTAWVRTPAEQLARPADASSGFGGCWSPPSEWPRP